MTLQAGCTVYKFLSALPWRSSVCCGRTRNIHGM